MTTADKALAGFSVEAKFIEEKAVLAVSGNLDASSSPTLGAFLDAVIVSGFLSVVVDLSAVERLDLVGLREITNAGNRLAALRGDLAIRSPSAMVTRVLNANWLGGLPRLEPPWPDFDRLGPEQSEAVPGTPVQSIDHNSVWDLRRIAAIPSDDGLVDSALGLVVSLASQTVGGADGVSVSLRRHGALSTVAASDRTISAMDADQYSTGEGPCVDASVEGRWFHAESMATETRWPAFTPKAHALGINAILSSPLMVRDKSIGALNIYSRTASAFGPSDQELASVFATEASIVLSEARVDVSDGELADRFREALRSREMIAEARGVIMEREGVDNDEAFSELRRFALWSGTPLLERAQDIVLSTQRPQPHLGDVPAVGPRG